MSRGAGLSPTSVHTTTSADGTRIAYDRTGEGPAVVVAAGAFCDRRSFAPLAARLAGEFTVLAYDRRGRGGSGDAEGYDPRREVEDLAAVVAAAGGSAAAFGHSSGAVLVLEAAAAGVPLTRVAAYEPPYSAEPAGTDLRDEVTALVAQGRAADAAKRFLAASGMPAEALAGVDGEPWWPPMAALAHTLPYDLALLGDGVPGPGLGRIAVPALLLGGGAGPDFFRDAVSTAAAAVPGAQVRFLDGQGHEVDQDVLAPVLAEFLRA